MIDTGIIRKGTFNGKETLGLRLNWHKRYITAWTGGDYCSVSAFKAYDPDHLIGSEEELGITVAPDSDRSAGRQHRPSSSASDAGVPERPELGQGRFHSDGLHHRRAGAHRPGLEDADDRAGCRPPHFAAVASSAGAAYCARATGVCARIREQFHVPIGKFEGIEEPLARIAGTAYQLDAARRLTCSALNQ